MPGSLFLCLIFCKEHFFTNFASQWGLSSVGLERMLDRHEVAGSNPVGPTAPSGALAKEGFLFLANY